MYLCTKLFGVFKTQRQKEVEISNEDQSNPDKKLRESEFSKAEDLIRSESGGIPRGKTSSLCEDSVT
ncbi:hypothetical protein JW766_05315 [Candidatus Dojkabacteria bacterium]|nr:hypothetical protein [Candidatus Dojkabacteria bacterium]